MDNDRDEAFDDYLLRRAMSEREAGMSSEDIELKFRDWMKTSASGVADALRDGLPSVIVAELRQRAGFEIALQQAWRPALELYDAIRIASIEYGSRWSQALMLHAEQPLRPKVEALTLIHVRGCLVASEIGALLRTGHPDGALARWRTAHELAVLAFFIGQHDAETAQRFLDHSAVLAERDAEEYQQYAAKLGFDALTGGELAEIKRYRDTVVSKYGSAFTGNYGWASGALAINNPKFHHLEAAVDLKHLRPYKMLATRHVHSDSKSLALGRIVFRGKQSFLAGPTNAYLSDAGHAALISLHHANVALGVFASQALSKAEPSMVLMALSELLDDAGEAFAAGEAFVARIEAEYLAREGAGDAEPKT